jgi:uncharacterized protein YkwD
VLARVLIASLCFLAVLAAPAGAGSRPAVPARATEAQLLAAVNAVRARHGRPLLRRSPELAAAARAHSEDMGRRGFFGHGSAAAFRKRIGRHYGADGFERWAAGENLLWSSLDVDAATIVRRWMKSSGHRANLLARQWREVGFSALRFSAAPGAYRGLDVTVVTADFGVRA